MKILLLGDASNFHATLAESLKAKGHSVVVASGGSGWMNTVRNINLYRAPGIAGTAKYALKLLKELPKMKGYDIVQVHNPIFLHLRPEKMEKIFDRLRKNNGKIVYEALGTDYNYVKACTEGKLFKYSDYRIGSERSPYSMASPENEKAWFAPEMKAYTEHFIDKVDGIIACLWEYYATYKDIAPEKLGYGGIPVNVKDIVPSPVETEPEKVKFFIGIQRDRSILKGTDRMLEALKAVASKYPDKCEMCIVENRPYKEYIELLHSSHVILDQLYSYTPATNALLAMARGMIAVSGAEPEYYDFIGETENRPIVNVSPVIENDIYNKLEQIVLNKSRLPEMSKRSIEFAVKHNAADTVADRHLNFWNTL